ncbi:MAG: HD-GYP domain-containing protein [Solibacillus sp.]
MEATFVRVGELRLGKVVAEDIFANTQYPIVFKNTQITYEHIHIFNAFSIANILVFKDELEEELMEQDEITTVTTPQLNTFEKYYIDAIGQFKREFSNWQAGAKIDLPKVRGMIIPLVDRVLEDRSYLFDLNSYSSPKDYVYHHCIATGLISAVITQKLGYNRAMATQMAMAGMLADCGMSKIPVRIREKKSSLTSQEFEEVRRHPYYSHLLVKDLPMLKEMMKEAIYQHHERLDGSGYPNGDRIGSISNFAQVIAVADVFHAMTSERLYRSKESPFKVIEMIKESEFGKFDIKVVQALMDIVVDLPIGTKIELSNLERGEVMFINRYAPTRPLVKLSRTGEIIDLSTKRSFHISRVITK